MSEKEGMLKVAPAYLLAQHLVSETEWWYGNVDLSQHACMHACRIIFLLRLGFGSSGCFFVFVFFLPSFLFSSLVVESAHSGWYPQNGIFRYRSDWDSPDGISRLVSLQWVWVCVRVSGFKSKHLEMTSGDSADIARIRPLFREGFLFSPITHCPNGRARDPGRGRDVTSISPCLRTCQGESPSQSYFIPCGCHSPPSPPTGP